jgi:hypothetical protein
VVALLRADLASGDAMLRGFLLCALVGPWLIGCGNDRAYDNGIDGGGGGVDGGDPASAHAGLPCDIETFLADHCQSCHGSTPSNGAPISLMTYGDLAARSSTGVPVAQRALARIKSPNAQMPPSPASVALAEIAIFEAWVNAGTPQGDCMAMPGPFDGPPVCSSGTTWTGGNRESPVMHPGLACIACHATSHDAAASGPADAPRFSIAGTVYPTGHEPNDCNGATAAVVEITDASGKVTSLPINAAGNFFTSAAIASPFHVAVVAHGKRRAMAPSPPNGDCNSCHTQNGANGAPGRIVLP